MGVYLKNRMPTYGVKYGEIDNTEVQRLLYRLSSGRYNILEW
jgi:hypothetical protein